jgi:hypothetical protein
MAYIVKRLGNQVVIRRVDSSSVAAPQSKRAAWDLARKLALPVKSRNAAYTRPAATSVTFVNLDLERKLIPKSEWR